VVDFIKKICYYLNSKEKEKHMNSPHRKLNGETKMYDIESPSTDHLFGNKRENLEEAGFKAKVRNRGNDWRSFRYDGVIALA
jgi:hypothetical protein